LRRKCLHGAAVWTHRWAGIVSGGPCRIAPGRLKHSDTTVQPHSRAWSHQVNDPQPPFRAIRARPRTAVRDTIRVAQAGFRRCDVFLPIYRRFADDY